MSALSTLRIERLPHRNSNVFGDKIVQADAYYMKGFSSTEGDDDSAAFALNFPNEPWLGDLLIKQIGRNFTRRWVS
jgi:hypothetical protein